MKSRPTFAKLSLSLVLFLLCLLTLTLAPTPHDGFGSASMRAADGQPQARSQRTTESPENALTPAKAREAYGKLELQFEANQGQTDASVDFLARGAGYAMFLKPAEAVFVLSRQGSNASTTGHTPKQFDEDVQLTASAGKTSSLDATPTTPAVLRMKLVGANESAAVASADELAGRVNYFKGNNPEQWHTDVRTYGRVRYNEVYPGIDLVYYGNQKQLEYDFVIAPGSDARTVSLQFEGADKVEVDAQGDLLLSLGDDVIRQPKPFVYQEVAGARREIEGSYAVGADGRVGFKVGEYDAARPLVIDPVLVYSTYLGGSGFEDGSDIKVDSAGHAYVCGQTNSTNFPTANAFQATFGGATFEGGRDGFVTKYNPTGTGYVYSTYLGGNGDDVCNKIAVDASGNAYLAGETTSSTNFPRANAFQNTFGGGLSDAFITKLNPTGSTLIFSTYLGGNIFDAASGIAVDSFSNSVYVTGRTTSGNFPTANAIQATQAGQFADAFVTKFNPEGNALVYSTYLGGSEGTEGGFDAGFSIAVDAFGNAYVTGQTRSTNFPTLNAVQPTFGGGFPDGDAFLTKINSPGNAILYSTYLGGSENDIGFEIAVGVATSNSAYVSGVTRSANFPTANAFQSALAGPSDAFLTRYHPNGGSYMFSTYFGGNGDDSANGIAVSDTGEPYLAIGTSSTNLPTVNPTQAANGGGIDAFIARFNSVGSALIYSSYLGGSGTDAGLSIALDSDLSIYLVGRTTSTNFPTLTPVQGTFGGDQDAFVTKIALDPPATPTPTPTPTPCTLTTTYSVSPVVFTLGGDQFNLSGRENSPLSLTTAAPVSDSFMGSVTLVPGASTTPVGEYTTTVTQTITFAGGATATLSRRLVYTVTASNRSFSLDSGETKTADLGAQGKIDIKLNTVSPFGTNSNNTTALLVFPARSDDATFQLRDIPGNPSCPTPSPTPTPTPRVVQFAESVQTVGEGAGSVTINVTRTGDTAAASNVDYSTAPDNAFVGCDVVSGTASERCDFTTRLGTLRFAAGETAKSFQIFITDDAYLDGAETFVVSLSNATGGFTIGSHATVTITDNDTVANAPNPIDNSTFFVKMHYVDFLNREGEPSGVAAWVNSLDTCTATDPFAPSSCDRIEVSSRFFRSVEFMLKGSFVIRFYRVSLGRNPGYRDFTRDSQRVTGQTSEEVFANRDAFTNEWVERADFKAAYDGLSNQAYVDKLEQTAGITLSNKAQLVADLNSMTKTRAQVLREVVESNEVRNKMYNDAFVLMEYFGYLRRDAEEAGFNAWLAYLNAHPGDYRTMVRGFINSVEYRKRFGAPGPPQPGQF